MENEFVVEIEKLIFGGEGLGRLPDGRSVFVPYVIPGEVVKVTLVEEKPRYTRGLPIEWVRVSDERIRPRCKHYGLCGGCHYQHIAYEAQLKYKHAIVVDQLTRIGKMSDLPVEEVIPSPKQWNYRNNIQFQPDDTGRLCYAEAQSTLLMPVEECHLPEEEINEIWPSLQLETDSGIRRVSVRKDSQDELMVVFEGEEEFPPNIELDMPVSAVYVNPESRSVNLSGEDALLFEVKGHDFRISPESFFQVNAAQAEAMIDQLLAMLPTDKKDLEILELYAGSGLFSVFLAERAAHLTAIEFATSACFDFAINLDVFDNVDLYEGPVDEILPNLELHPDWVVLDPPRAGLDKITREALIGLDCPNIIYISCDPATLARDVKHFGEAEYKVETIRPLDMFPQTYHIETIVLMSRVKE